MTTPATISPPVPTPAPAASAFDQLQHTLLEKLRLNFGERVGMTSPVSSMATPSGHYLLTEALRIHFKVPASVAADIVASSRTVTEIAHRLAEVKGLAKPSLFYAGPAPAAVPS